MRANLRKKRRLMGMAASTGARVLIKITRHEASIPRKSVNYQKVNAQTRQIHP